MYFWNVSLQFGSRRLVGCMLIADWHSCRDLAAAGAWPIGRGGSSDGRPSPTRDRDAACAPSWPWPAFGVALPPPPSCRPGSKQRCCCCCWSDQLCGRATPETGLSTCRGLCTRGSPPFSGYFTTREMVEDVFAHLSSNWIHFDGVGWGFSRKSTGLFALASKDVNWWGAE